MDEFVQEIIHKLKNFDEFKDENELIWLEQNLKELEYGLIASIRYDDDPVGQRTFRIDYGGDRIKDLHEEYPERWEPDIRFFVKKILGV